MNSVHRDIFRAIHEGKWISIEYSNKQNQVTRYWIGIHNINVPKRTLSVEGMHLGRYSLDRYDTIYIDSIQSSQIIEGSFYPINKKVIADIHLYPDKYKTIFDNVANLKILDYLEDCNRMDATPYRADYALVRFLDRESFTSNAYQLNDEQFKRIVIDFQMRTQNKQKKISEGITSDRVSIQQLAMNVMSIHTSKGLYVLAYRKLYLDVKNRCLRPDEDITICTEFTIDGTKESVRKFLDAEDYELLYEFDKNQEKIKDAITHSNRNITSVDDMPYIIGLGIESVIDLHREYGAIIEMYNKNSVPIPIKAFFGDLLERPRSKKAEPITLLDSRINLDQLLAIDHAIRYPVAYVQGPPGTGKTNTIINTIITAFFNEKTLLFTSYNNHPIDSVVDKLSKLTYRGKTISFPVVRLGNNQKIKEALIYIKRLYEETKDIKVFDKTLNKKKDNRTEKMKRLSVLLKKYENQLDLKERCETIDRMLDHSNKQEISMQKLAFEENLRGEQLGKVKRKLDSMEEITDEDALSLLLDDTEELKKYLFYTSAKYIQKIDSPEQNILKEILYMEDEEKQVKKFQEYLRKPENLKRFLKIFPIVVTTCISAHKLGEPEPYFDMMIMDEASQCNIAVGLVPILRAKKALLVGDPQQLNPVIVLDDSTNQKLKKKYSVSDEYDYKCQSIYKAFLACDSVSDEVLLRYHYRCNKKIIDFNNRKYYNSRLIVKTDSKESRPLKYVNVTDGHTNYKNTSPAEIEEIVQYAIMNRDKSIGVITPFVNQKKAIEVRLEQERLTNVTCGTVHAYQGDEKDVILFSTAITDQTHSGTYEWLKNNKELINVATSRAREQLIVFSNTKNLERLHQENGEDDLFDLIRYVRSNGTTEVAAKEVGSRALGIKPFSSIVEEAFLTNLSHALENIWLSQNRFSVEKEVAVAQVFDSNINYSDLFYSGRFDFVVYEQRGNQKYPVLVIELDGKEHYESDIVMARDRKKQEICAAHQMELIRVENSYARRYQHIKEILKDYFKMKRY